MELVDIYDENRAFTGKIKDRKDKLNDGEYIIAVGMWVINDNHEILLTKRSPEKKFAPNKWENTGGHVMAGENSEDAVIRELFEETGICATKDDISFLGTAKVTPYFGDNFAVRKDVDIGDIKLQEGETCDAKWVSISEFEQMIKNGDLAQSVTAHMEAYKESFYRAVKKD